MLLLLSIIRVGFFVNCSSAHQTAHQRADERLTRLKWPWERLYNYGEDSVDLTEESSTSQNDHQRSVIYDDDDVDDDNCTPVILIVIVIAIYYTSSNGNNSNSNNVALNGLVQRVT